MLVGLKWLKAKRRYLKTIRDQKVLIIQLKEQNKELKNGAQLGPIPGAEPYINRG